MVNINRRAANDLAMKMKLEEQLKKPLRKMFINIINQFEAEYISSELILNLDDYKADLQAILKEGYRRTAKTFKTNLRNEKQLTNKEIDKLIDVQLSTFINNQTGYQTDIIISTIGKNLVQEVDDVIIEAAATGTSLSKTQIAAKTKTNFRKKIDGKIGIIATTETQIVAEKSKLVEATILNEHTDEKVVKQWVSTLDEVTRIAHVFADGQQQELQDPFIVGGERLMHPGDTSLGASAGNIIECRCDLVYIKE